MSVRRRRTFARLLWPVVSTTLSIAAYTSHPAALEAMQADIPTRAIGVLAGAAAYYSSAWLCGRLIGLALERAGTRRRQMPKLLLELIAAALFLAASMATIMLVIGQSWSGALAGSGLVIAVLGFALRSSLADVFAGIAISIESPYRIGDWVAIDDQTKGRVIEIGWRSTRLFTRDDTYVILPNSQVARQKLTNYSTPNRKYRTQVQIVLSYDLSIADAKRLLSEAATKSRIIDASPPPDVRVTSYDGNGICYQVRFWVPSFAADVDCRDAVFAAIDAALRARGLPLPVIPPRHPGGCAAARHDIVELLPGRAVGEHR